MMGIPIIGAKKAVKAKTISFGRASSKIDINTTNNSAKATIQPNTY